MPATYLSVDLADKASITRSIAQLRSATVVVYTAYCDESAVLSADQAQYGGPNQYLFHNVMEYVVPFLPNLRRVVLIEGVKAYGVHLGPFKTPAAETDPRPVDSVFYFFQEDLLKEKAVMMKDKWTWTVLRPDAVCGPTAGFPMNVALGVAVYASICKELRVPLKFPGSVGGYHTLSQVTDSKLLANAIIWAGTAPSCTSEVINVTNGDLFRWENVWPKIAKLFEIDVGALQQVSLAAQMPHYKRLWDAMRTKHSLTSPAIDAIVSWGFVDWLLTCDYDVISNVNRLRKLGFHEAVDTEQMFVDIIMQFKAQKTIP